LYESEFESCPFKGGTQGINLFDKKKN
jgi:hypothetical protein